MFYFIEWLRAAAAILVANSHFKGVYPNDILSFGGGFGLGLFYMISGFLLANISGDAKFGKWYLPKLVRLYVPLVIAKAVCVLAGTTAIPSFAGFVQEFIFPGTWFSASMVLMYPIYFCLVKYVFRNRSVAAPAVTAALLAVCYCVLFISKAPIASFSLMTLRFENDYSIKIPFVVTQCVWLFCMVAGYTVRKTGLKIRRRTGWIAVFAVSVLSFLVLKLATRGGRNPGFQIFFGLVYAAFAFSLFMLFQDQESFFAKWQKGAAGKLIGVISACSLEMYYVQFAWIEVLKGIPFPVNLVLLFVSIIASAWALHWLSGIIMKRLFPGAQKGKEKDGRGNRPARG